MNVFTFIAFVGGLSAIGSFVPGAGAMVRNADHGYCDGSCWAWRSLFTFCVFVTILSALLSG